jgi:HEAT repeat protein
MLLCVLGAFVFGFFSREPRYHGKSLSEWLRGLPSVTDLSFFPQNPAPGSAVEALRHMGSSATPFLIRMVNARSSAVSERILTVLERQDFIKIPLRHAEDDQIEGLKGLCALGSVAEPAIPAVARMIREGQNPQRAMCTLAGIGPDSIHVFVACLQNRNRTIRSNAAGFLGNFKEHGGIIVPALMACLDDPDESFRHEAASALGRFGSQAWPAIPRLLQLVHQNSYDIGAINALIGIDFEGTLRTFTNELQSSDAQVRARAASVLGCFRDRGRPAVPALLAGLKDQKEIVRTSAAIALGQIGEDGDLVVPALLENLKDGSLIERTMTADALSSFGQRGKAAVPVILDLMEQQKANEVYRSRLQGALGRIDPDAFKLKTER